MSRVITFMIEQDEDTGEWSVEGSGAGRKHVIVNVTPKPSLEQVLDCVRRVLIHLVPEHREPAEGGPSRR